jgi:hypothetical protein
LLATTVYCLALLTGQSEFIAQAKRTRASIFSTNGSLSKNQDGWLAPDVDPLNVAVEGKHSPEGEAFVLMLYVAWRNWSKAGRPGSAKSSGAWKQALDGAGPWHARGSGWHLGGGDGVTSRGLYDGGRFFRLRTHTHNMVLLVIELSRIMGFKMPASYNMDCF